MIYPWQTEQWLQLLRTKQGDRLPHALLFIGIRGMGKAHFAEHFIRAQFCHRLDKMSGYIDGDCECHACRLVAGRTHPNVLWIEPEKEGSAIKIDQIRDVKEFVNQTSLQGEYRFTVINPANHMNNNAANALLKTLEEPSSGSILILISEQASHLPATILSRCQHIYFPPPRAESALTWLTNTITDSTIDPELVLHLANGAPLAAIQLLQGKILPSRSNLLHILYALNQKQADPIKSGASLNNVDLIHIIDFTLSWVMDVLRLHLEEDAGKLINKDFVSQLSDVRNRTRLTNVIQFMDYLQQLRSHIMNGINLNKQLMIESLLIRWMECTYVSR